MFGALFQPVFGGLWFGTRHFLYFLSIFSGPPTSKRYAGGPVNLRILPVIHFSHDFQVAKLGANPDPTSLGGNCLHWRLGNIKCTLLSGNRTQPVSGLVLTDDSLINFISWDDLLDYSLSFGWTIWKELGIGSHHMSKSAAFQLGPCWVSSEPIRTITILHSLFRLSSAPLSCTTISIYMLLPFHPPLADLRRGEKEKTGFTEFNT